MPADPTRRAAAARITRREVSIYQQHGLLVESEVASPEADRRVRRIRRLRRDLGLSYDAIALVERLVERIEELEGRSTGDYPVRVVLRQARRDLP
jgi:DNA-binding transcriptional MerR regulator